jgi:hypothetical protein
LREYLKLSNSGHVRIHPDLALSFHSTLARKGDMRLTDYAEFFKG